MSEYVVGIDLGGTSIKGALVEPAEGIVRSATIDTEAHRGFLHVLDEIAELVADLMEQSAAPILGVGIGAPGIPNLDRTTIKAPPNIPGWREVDLRTELRRRLQSDLQVIVENDANVAALGSCYYGAGRMFDSFIMVTLGTGVGGAIISNNRIFRGATGGAGEIGHMTIDYEGPMDKAGVAGSIEAYLGQRFLTRHARYHLINYPESGVYDLAGADLGSLTPKILYEAAQGGDKAAQRILSWAGHKLGCALGSAVNLLDIRKVVIGGGLSGAGDFILEAAREALHQFVTPGLRDDLEIVREHLGNEVALLGAARLVWDEIVETTTNQVR